MKRYRIMLVHPCGERIPSAVGGGLLDLKEAKRFIKRHGNIRLPAGFKYEIEEK